MLRSFLLAAAMLGTLPVYGQTCATVEVWGETTNEDYAQATWWMEFYASQNSGRPVDQGGGGGGGVGGGGIENPPSLFASYYAEWVSNEYKYPFRQIAKIESPSGAKISFQNVDSLKKMWNYEISLQFSRFGVALGGGYEAMNTVTIGWEKQLPNMPGTYLAVANEGIINDYYNIIKKTVLGEVIVADKQLAQKHDKITVELYRNGVRMD